MTFSRRPNLIYSQRAVVSWAENEFLSSRIGSWLSISNLLKRGRYSFREGLQSGIVEPSYENRRYHCKAAPSMSPLNKNRKCPSPESFWMVPLLSTNIPKDFDMKLQELQHRVLISNWSIAIYCYGLCSSNIHLAIPIWFWIWDSLTKQLARTKTTKFTWRIMRFSMIETFKCLDTLLWDFLYEWENILCPQYT